ncbi:MAG TPA: rhodanese-like domain-containing protein [Chthoniobacterales bacterium]|nr:rhodanese-like domain-containing protein [Chthoniobacterales bacterium]
MKRAIREALLLLALACLPAIAEGFYFRDKVSWQSAIRASELVTVDTAKAWGESALWVDARPDEEYAQDHVPGAFSLNEDHWDELLAQFLPNWSPDRKVIVYCSAQSCNTARDVAKRLRESTQPPMQNVFVLEGGWEEWVKKK